MFFLHVRRSVALFFAICTGSDFRLEYFELCQDAFHLEFFQDGRHHPLAPGTFSDLATCCTKSTFMALLDEQTQQFAQSGLVVEFFELLLYFFHLLPRSSRSNDSPIMV